MANINSDTQIEQTFAPVNSSKMTPPVSEVTTVTWTAKWDVEVILAPKKWPKVWPYGTNYKKIAPEPLSAILFNWEREWFQYVENHAVLVESKIANKFRANAKKQWKKCLWLLRKGKYPEWELCEDLERAAPHMLLRFAEISEQDRKNTQNCLLFEKSISALGGKQ